MDSNKLFELYEKSYLHEIEMREKLNARLQTPLAILISVIGVLAFMLRNFYYSGEKILFIVFALFYIISFLLILAGMNSFKNSWYGYEYSFLPSAEDTEKYRQLLIETYSDYEDNDELVNFHFQEYLKKYYIECSSTNTNVNDKRSLHLHFTNKFIILGTIFAFMSFVPFHFGKFDKNLKETATSVKITEPVEIKGVIIKE